MRTVSYRIGDLNKAVIHIGRVAENEYTRVQIDAGEIFAEYPNAIATLAVQPPEGYAYPATVTREGNLVIWDVKDVDLAAEGKGEIQLTFTEDNVVVKSCIGRIQVCRSIVGDGEAPEPLLDWLTEATQVLGDLEGLGDIAAGATDADIGKALSPKTVEDGVVTEWQYTDAVGKPFTIKKTFSSVSAMLSYTGTDIEEHDFALINSTDADNGKLFQYEPNKNLLDLTTLKAPAFAGQTYSYSLTATWDGVGQIIYIWHDGGTSGEAISMIPKPRSGQSITTTGTTTAEAGCTGFTFSFPSGVEVTAGSVTAKWIYVGNLSTSMTVPIDDTAGTGVTNKVWSANKSASENSALLSAINGKIDEPSSEGTSGQVLTTDGNGGRSWTTPSGGGTSDYTDLTNKPQIDGVTLAGNKSLSDLGIASVSSVSGKLDAPLTAGASGQVLVSDGNGGQVWGTTGTGTIVVDNTLSVQGAAADAKKTGEVNNKVENMLVASVNEFLPDFTIHDYTKIDASDGSIDTATNASEKVMEFSVAGCNKFRMQASAYGGNSGAKYAFYTAESYSACGTATLIGSVQTYDRRADIYDYDIPSNAKWCCVYISSKSYISCVKYKTNIKGYASIANEYDPEKGKYKVGESIMHSGLMYQCIVPITTPETWNDAHWVLTTINDQIENIVSETNDISKLAKFQIGTTNASTGEITTNQKYAISSTNLVYFEETTEVFVTNGYDAKAFYFDANGTYNGTYKNIANTEYHYNIIPAGSNVRFQIGITGSTDTLTTMDIPTLSNKITYESSYAKMRNQVAENEINVSNGMVARMFEKGASPKSFSHAIGIICAGQSNIAGVIDSSDIPSTITFPMTNIKYSRSNTPTTFDDGISSSADWGVDLAMFDALNKLNGGTFYGVKYAAAGTGIDLYSSSDNNARWTAYYERLDSIDKSLLYKLETKIRTLATNYPNTYDIRAMVWHQGENDSTFSNNGDISIPKRYYENFKFVIAYVRGIVENERLPVIYGTISHNSIAYDPIVEKAQLRIAEEDPNVYCIDMSGAALKDDYHFNAASAVYFGQKAFDALIDFGIITGTKINPVPPWED